MARTKTKRTPYSAAATATATATATASRPRTTTAPTIQTQTQNPNPNPNPNQNQEEEEDEKEKSKTSSGGHLVSLLTSAISLSLRFLSDADLLLPPSSALSLSSLVRSSALSLSSLIALLRSRHHHQFPNNLPFLLPSPSRPLTTTPFPWFRRFLASSSSPSDPRWLHNFRMSKPSFYLLLQTLSPSLLPLSSTSFPSSPIPADHKLAAALFRLAHAAPFPFVARRFGLNSPSLAARAFYETLRAVTDHLAHLFELSSDTPRILHAFNWLSLPNCCGVLSFSRFGSLIAQCLVDSEGRFLDVSVGWHGSMSPEEVLPKTKLFAAQATVLGSGSSAIELSRGALVPRYFIAGPCCPMLQWLLTPYKDLGDPGLLSSTSSKAAVFNTVHARGMEVADRAFARLRAWWRLLTMEWTEECVDALPYVVVASCLLHNYLVKCSEPVPEVVERCGMEMMGFKEFEGKGDEEGERIRDVIASHLSQVIHK